MRNCEELENVANLLKLCQDKPSLFNKLFLNRPAYWSRQIDLCRSVVEYRTTVAYSGNMVGKDYWIAGIILWWLLTRLVLQRHVRQLSMAQVIIFQELKSFLRISIRTWLMDQNPCETSHFLAIGVLTQRCSTSAPNGSALARSVARG